jgi:hypothetical protein
VIIYPLNPEELDDKTLDKQIKNIAQALCNAQWMIRPYAEAITIPLALKPCKLVFINWAAKCRANYLTLVQMGIDACEEYTYRFSERGYDSKWKDAGWLDFSIPFYKKLKHHKLKLAMEWAHTNIPELPLLKTEEDFNMGFPLPPKKYVRQVGDEAGWFPEIISSYRLYYRSKIYKKIHGIDCVNLPIIDTDPNYPKWTRREMPEYLK